jgi:hypothetical protein
VRAVARERVGRSQDTRKRGLAHRWRCQDGQPLSFSAASVWGVTTGFRLQIGMIPRGEQSIGTPQASVAVRLPHDDVKSPCSDPPGSTWS